jgi:hypothetical protein
VRRIAALIAASSLGCTAGRTEGAPDGGTAEAASATEPASARAAAARFGRALALAGRTEWLDGPRDASSPELARAAAPVAITDPRGATIGVRLVGARDALAETVGRTLVYRAAGAGGEDLLRVASREETEDFVRFATRPERTHVAWEVALSDAVAGLRAVGGVIEVLDARGVPRFRASAPWVVDARGVRRSAHASVEGCSFDRDPRPPWGRPVVAPGSRRCTISVTFSDEGLEYPIVHDPAWNTTGSMTAARVNHVAAPLPGNRVLVAGGNADSAGDLSSAEIFDSSSRTWAVTSTMSAARTAATATTTTTGSILVVGGASTAAEFYDPTTGTWTLTGAMSTPRAGHTASLLPGGGVLAVGGFIASAAATSSVERYDATTNTWTVAASTNVARGLHFACTLTDGRILVGGGADSASTNENGISQAEIYDPTLDRFSLVGSMKLVRSSATCVTMPDGRVLAAGGEWPNFYGWASAEAFDPATLSWKDAAPMDARRAWFTMTALGGGRFLAVGVDAYIGSPTTTSAQLFDAASATWLATPPPAQPRLYHTATALAGGRVLIAGGRTGNSVPPLSTAEIYDRGATCVGSSDCNDGFCVDGVCCDSACTGSCEACDVAPRVGTCTTVPFGDVPHGTRAPCGTGVCAGTCGGVDGARCTSFPGTDVLCSAPVCADAAHASTASGCDAAGACTAPAVVDCGGFVCDSTTARCLVTCSSNVDCANGYQCVGGGCQKLASGASCTDAGSCASGYCVDGVCCASASCSAGMRCDLPARPGVCSVAQGHACGGNADCATGFCVDGVCCDRPCRGQCEACDGATMGTCAAVSGAPHGVRPRCAGTDACAGACDGTARDVCVFPSSAVACADASCSAGVASFSTFCDGSGSCAAPSTKRCEPFACRGAACAESCAADVDCAVGYTCDAPTGRCIAGARCDGDHTVVIPNATPRDCSPYVCAGTACLGRCEGSSDCVAGFECDPTTSTCTATAPSGASGGCAAARSNAGGGAVEALIALGGVVAGRRRRRVGREKAMTQAR